MRKPRQFRVRTAFTLIEVLVAMFVMATLSAGLLVMTWRLIAFAHDEADRMVADNFAHDLMRAVYSQDYSNIVSVSRFDIDPEKVLPRVVSKDVFGRESVTYPLWRHQDELHKPACKIDVTEEEDRRTIDVKVFWWNGDAKKGFEERRYPDVGDAPLTQVRPQWGDGQ